MGFDMDMDEALYHEERERLLNSGQSMFMPVSIESLA